MGFLSEPEPVRGEPLRIAEGVLRLVARNPSLMTYHGTNTYLCEEGSGLILIDPGPIDDATHIEDILRVAGGRIRSILLTHAHKDHCGALPVLQEKTQAKLYAFHTPLVESIVPDVPLSHGDQVGAFTALHTPGHAPDHLCYARDDGVLFSGDHVMTWSSSIVSPPSGSMKAYCESLSMLLRRHDGTYLPGHGPRMDNPHPYVAQLLRRRVEREQEILKSLRTRPATTIELVNALYSKTDPFLARAAERNVVAHLDKLESEGEVAQVGETWVAWQ